jgi:sugar phosphate isomerase/epimerase
MVPDPAQAAEKLQALCRSASEFELNVAVEFLRYTGVKTIDDAVMLVRASGADNAFVLLDSFHLHQAGHRPEDILAYPASCFPYLQLCDAPGPPDPDNDEVMRQARTERLNPGEGVVDLAGIIRALPPELPISLEVPNLARIAQVGEMAHAIRLRQDAEKLLREIDAP